MAEMAKVTPQAFTHCRSTGESRLQRSGSPSSTDPSSRPPENTRRATAPDTLANSKVRSNSRPSRIAMTHGPSGESARPMKEPVE
jgi:hypothetical protein